MSSLSLQMKGEAARAYYQAAKEYPPKFQKLVKDAEFHLDLKFNLDKIGLLVKKLPMTTYRGFNGSK